MAERRRLNKKGVDDLVLLSEIIFAVACIVQCIEVVHAFEINPVIAAVIAVNCYVRMWARACDAASRRRADMPRMRRRRGWNGSASAFMTSLRCAVA